MPSLTALPRTLTRAASASADLNVLALWNRLSSLPGGKSLFTRAVSLKAPYFGSVRPHIEELRPGFCEVHVKDRRRVRNHLGTVHAIAMCNMAELAGGMATDVTTPPHVRWIPVGMTVEYKRKARGTLRAVATLDPIPEQTETADVVANVEILDRADEVVMKAAITMRVSPKP